MGWGCPKNRRHLKATVGTQMSSYGFVNGRVAEDHRVVENTREGDASILEFWFDELNGLAEAVEDE